MSDLSLGVNEQDSAPPAPSGANEQNPAASATPSEGVNRRDPAPPATPGANEQDPAPPATPEEKPDDGKASGIPGRDAAIADIRRKLEAAEKRATVAESAAAERLEALQYFWQGDNPVAEALAQAKGISPEEAAERLADKKELAALREAFGKMTSEKISLEVSRAMERDLDEIRKIDPAVKSLDDLGPTFFELIGTGRVSGTEAYYAVKAKQAKESKTPPPPVGTVNAVSAEKDFYTKEEVRAMSKEQRLKAHNEILSSMKKW
jgi:hypothetical protein